MAQGPDVCNDFILFCMMSASTVLPASLPVSLGPLAPSLNYTGTTAAPAGGCQYYTQLQLRRVCV